MTETLIGTNGEFILKQTMASQTNSKTLDAIDPRALAHYLAPFRDPSRIHAMCEDYRAGATIDTEHDAADRGNRFIHCPLLSLWCGGRGRGRERDFLLVCQRWAIYVRGCSLPCGLFLPEEDSATPCAAVQALFGDA